MAALELVQSAGLVSSPSDLTAKWGQVIATIKQNKKLWAMLFLGKGE